MKYWYLILLITVHVYSEKKSIATIIELKGKVEILKPYEETYLPTFVYMPLEEKDKIKTYTASSARIIFDDGTIIMIEENTEITLGSLKQEIKKRKLTMNLNIGKILGNVSKEPDKEIEIISPHATIAIRGTEFAAEVEDIETTNVGVFEGEVTVKSLTREGKPCSAEIFVRAGKETFVKVNRPPTKPFPLRQKMGLYKQRLLKDREKMKLLRKRHKEIMAKREQEREKILEHWRKIKERRIKQEQKKRKHQRRR